VRCSRTLNAFAFLLVSCVSIIASAETKLDLCTYTPKEIISIFSNGVGNPKFEAAASQEALSSALQNKEITPGRYPAVDLSKYVGNEPKSYLLYHANNGFIQDVTETLLQKARDEAKTDVTWDSLIGALTGTSGVVSITLAQAITALTNFRFEEVKDSATQQIQSDYLRDYSILQGVIKSNPDSRFLIVGHSQGSLYANAVYNKVVADPQLVMASTVPLKDRLIVVNVGAAASSVGGQDPSSVARHVTSNYDAVIAALRIFSPGLGLSGPLPNNSTSSHQAGLSGGSIFDPDGILNHGFVSTYLADASAQNSLQSMLLKALQQQFGPSNVKSGYQIDVEIKEYGNGLNLRPDSSFSGNMAPSIINAPYDLGGWSVFSEPIVGVTTYVHTFSVPCANMASTLNLRPDDPARAMPIDALSMYFGLGIAGSGNSLVSQRYRFSSIDGSSSGPWIDIPVASVVQGPWSFLYPVMQYSESMDETGLHMSIQ